jgi:pimeloyl-ACP methyl ester carboxylesterase
MKTMNTGSFIRLPSAEIHVVDSGGTGTPHVLVHGLGGNHTNWIEVFDSLADRGRTIAMDLPGYGYSPPIDHHDLDSLAAVVIELLETLDQPAVLIGNSMGGLLAAMVAATRPGLVADLILIAPASPIASLRHHPDSGVAARLAAQSFPGLGTLVTGAYRRFLTPEQLTQSRLDIVAADASTLPERVRTTSLAMARRRAAMPWATRALVESTASMRHTFVPPWRFRRMIASITHPALVLSGDRDVLVAPEAIDALEALRPDWTFHRLEGIGHVPQMENAGWVLDEIDHWTTRYQRKARAT